MNPLVPLLGSYKGLFFLVLLLLLQLPFLLSCELRLLLLFLGEDILVALFRATYELFKVFLQDLALSGENVSTVAGDEIFVLLEELLDGFFQAQEVVFEVMRPHKCLLVPRMAGWVPELLSEI